MKIKKLKQKPIKLKIQKTPKCLQMQSKIKQATKNMLQHSFLHWPTTPGHGVFPECG